MTNYDEILREYMEKRKPKTWKDVVPDCSCSEENEWFCPACIKWYIDVTY